VGRIASELSPFSAEEAMLSGAPPSEDSSKMPGGSITQEVNTNPQSIDKKIRLKICFIKSNPFFVLSL
jgi:hypothetical protein